MNAPTEREQNSARPTTEAARCSELDPGTIRMIQHLNAISQVFAAADALLRHMGKTAVEGVFEQTAIREALRAG